MRSFLYLVLLFFPLMVNAGYVPPADDNLNERKDKRAWLARGAYTKQDNGHWFEAGIGRTTFITSAEPGVRGVPIAGASFTFGADMGLSDTSFIFAPKMAVEAWAWIIGGRVSYGYYMQDGNASGVIGIEGGFCILSYVSLYAGYNFVKGHQQYPVINEGMRISVALNYPFGIRKIDPPKSPTHL